jgi:hypothetical protein
MVINEGDSVWTYLTAPSSMTPVSDGWLLNLVDAPETLANYRDNGLVPPATQRFTLQPNAMSAPATEVLSSIWSEDGEAVAVLVSDRVLAFLQSSRKTGFSRFLSAAGPFGDPLDHALFSTLFGQSADPDLSSSAGT